MTRVSIIGAGNLGTHIFNKIEKISSLKCVQWIGKSENGQNIRLNNRFFENYQFQIESDICILAVPDKQISIVSKKLKNIKSLVVHTSGASSINDIKSVKRKGVFYPIQSFIKGVELNLKEYPICIDAAYKNDLDFLKEFSKKFSSLVHQINDKQRLKIHTSAVFANNFSNHLISISQKLLKKSNLSYKLLHPLVNETFNRSFTNNCIDTQSGPAIRNDKETQKKHLSVLNKNEKEIYLKISKSINKSSKNGL